MGRKHLRSVSSSYELEGEDENPRAKNSLDLADDLADGSFSSYDPDAFYLRATDYHGHVKNLQVAIPTGYGPLVDQVVNDPGTPYRTIAEAARNWIIHGLVREMRRLELDSEDAQTFMIEVEMERLRAVMEADQRYLDHLAELCPMLVEKERWFDLNALLHDAEQRELTARPDRARRDGIVAEHRTYLPEGFALAESYDV